MNKYKAKKTTIDGIKFDSKGEAARYSFLLLMQKAGQIKNLERQIVFVLHAGNGQKIGKYIADFQYELPDGKIIVEDFKGIQTPLFRWKAKHLFAEYGKMVKITKKYNDDIK
jgi:hypothetical protein